MDIQLLEFIAVLTAGLTAGSAIYISLVIQPAWLKTSRKSAVENFAPVFNGSFASQAVFSTIAILVGVALGIMTDQNLWIVGSVLMSFNIPFTKYILMPVNYILLGQKGEFSDAESTKLFKKWGAYQWLRTITVLIGFILFLWLTIYK